MSTDHIEQISEPTAVEPASPAPAEANLVSATAAIQQAIDELRPHAAAVAAAPLDVRLAVAGPVVCFVAAWFEWWHGVARVQAKVAFSALGSGNAFSDWRGWLGLVCMVAVLCSAVFVALQGPNEIAVKVMAYDAAAALALVAWFWASFSNATSLSEGMSVQFGAGFGLYLALVGCIAATVGGFRVLRQWRSQQSEAAAAD